MAKCGKCGARVEEGFDFCPSCGASLKLRAAPPPPEPSPRRERYEKEEKEEKEEKHEKAEKAEKYEKREFGFTGSMIAGIILIVLGLFFYLTMARLIDPRLSWAYFFVVIGIAIILAAIYGAAMASRRHPRS